MINVFRPRTYQEVAAEIAEGLMSGDLVREGDETQEDLASFAWFALSFVHPVKISCTVAAARTAGRPCSPGRAQVTMEIGADELASLPSAVKHKLLLQLNELRGRGVQVDLTDTAGTPLRLEEGNGLAATGEAMASNH